jgi:hypothetical protein
MESNVAAAVRTARILKIAFLVSGILFIYVVYTVPVQAQGPTSPAFEMAIAVVALASVVAGFILPGILRRAAERVSQNKPGSTPLSRWMAGNIVGLACFESCSMFAVMLHFAGGHVRTIELLFAVGLIALLFWSPGNPPDAEENRG